MDPIDREAARRALPEAGARLLRMLRASEPDTPVPGSDWRIAEVASHLGYVLHGFTEAATGNSAQYARYVPQEQDFHQRLAAVNGTLVRELAESTEGRPFAAAVTMIEEGLAAFLAATATLDPDAPLDTPWYGPGVTRTPDTLTALALGECLVHGLDIARATGTPWPIERAEATVVAREVFARMLPLMLTETGRATTVAYRIRWRGAPQGAPDLVIRLAGGRVAVGPPAAGERVDCRISADPVAFLLVGYGRAATWRETLTGRIFAWGRRPWMAARLVRLFCRP